MIENEKQNEAFFKRRGVINGITYLCIVTGVVFFLFAWASLPYLSAPPDRGLENRQYSECKDDSTSRKDCSPSLGSNQNNSAEENSGGASSPKYRPNNFIKDKRDLTAQEGMWRATNLVAVYAFIQVFVGLAGVVLIGLTLGYTKNAMEAARLTLEQARETTRAADKATVATEKGEAAHVFVVFKGKTSKDRRNFTIKPTIKNFGNTHALNVSYRFLLSKDGVGLPNEDGAGSMHFRVDEELPRDAKLVLASGQSLGSMDAYSGETLTYFRENKALSKVPTFTVWTELAFGTVFDEAPVKKYYRTRVIFRIKGFRMLDSIMHEFITTQDESGLFGKISGITTSTQEVSWMGSNE